jgi:hypothetical protein
MPIYEHISKKRTNPGRYGTGTITANETIIYSTVKRGPISKSCSMKTQFDKFVSYCSY